MKIKLIALGGLLALATPVLADVAYSNFNATYDLDTQGWIIGDTGNGVFHDAFSFTAAASGQITDVLVGAGLNLDSNPNDRLLVNIWDDATGVPGSLVWQGSIDPTLIDPIQVWTVSNVLQSGSLTAGNTYWLSLQSELGANQYNWAWTSPNINGNGAFDDANGTNWVTFPGVEGSMEINVVPEPATLAVLGFGGLALLRRKRKSA